MDSEKKPIDRGALAREICGRLDKCVEQARAQWGLSSPLHHFVVDDVLPEQWVRDIRASFPNEGSMILKRSWREAKFVAAQMDRYDPLLEESIYAFQDPRVVEKISSITGLARLEPDSALYAGGISLMAPGNFLNPHIDNSHDRFRQRYRVLNLLYYVSPGWSEGHGGNLELWPKGPSGKPITIVSRFNRLVVMVTHRYSWHSVSRNRSDAQRCCVSNYYFSPEPIEGGEYYHVTEFRGRPEERVRDLALRADNWLRTAIRKSLPTAFANRHFYVRSKRSVDDAEVRTSGSRDP